MHALIFLNPRSGPATPFAPKRRERTLLRHFRAVGIKPTFVEFPHDFDAASDIKADVYVAAGGDGTVNAVANLALRRRARLGVVPLGTRNHFARDLGLPREPKAAIRTIARGRARRVDVAEVNGHAFLNNSSIGLYPRLVHQREELRNAHGQGKWAASARATASVLRRNSRLDVRIETENGFLRHRTPFVFVGNNPYELDFFVLGRRPRLDTGLLSLYYSRHAGRSASLRLALRSLFGRLDQGRDFESRTASVVRLHSRRPRLRVAFDGEVRKMAPPLEYRSRPRALTVLAPRRRQ